VADEDHATEPELIGDGHDVLGERGHRPHVATDVARLAMARKIDRNDPLALAELVQLMPPVPAVAGPSVDEHERRLAGSANLERERDPIGRDGAAFHVIHCVAGRTRASRRHAGG
jgi:hypothetical protein